MPQCEQRNLSMMMDLYELTMANGYFADGQNTANMVTFDVFYRKNPDGGGFAVFAGLEQIVEYIVNLHFEEKDIQYLRSLGLFQEDFLAYLNDYRFHGNVDAFPEETIMFPNEPILSVTAQIGRAHV